MKLSVFGRITNVKTVYAPMLLHNHIILMNYVLTNGKLKLGNVLILDNDVCYGLVLVLKYHFITYAS